MKTNAIYTIVALGVLAAASANAQDDDTELSFVGLAAFPNSSGLAATYSTKHRLDLSNPFFQSLGRNGRSCNTCHQQGEGWTVTPPQIEQRFNASAGMDPIFRLNDGANSPLADVSSVDARRRAYSMLLTKSLIRVGIGIPDNAEFDLVAVDDPYGFASKKELSLFRRPLPTTNLKFLSTIMWDGRETLKDANSPDCLLNTTTCFASIHFDLAHQSNEATVGHAEASQPLSQAQREAIVEFQLSLFTAQIFDNEAGKLKSHGARSGPKNLARQRYYFGMNDPIDGDYRTRRPFNPNVFTLYGEWANSFVLPGRDDKQSGGQKAAAARRAVARGEALFNTKPIAIKQVKGLNDDLNIAEIPGTCTTCHDTPNAGNHSVPSPLDIGLTDASRRTPDMPLYTLRNKDSGETLQTTDPGRALITGKWRDIGRFKGPILRALATRAPYFHNGFAKDLAAVRRRRGDRHAILFGKLHFHFM